VTSHIGKLNEARCSQGEKSGNDNLNGNTAMVNGDTGTGEEIGMMI
jgi:hypothetical protein